MKKIIKGTLLSLIVLLFFLNISISTNNKNQGELSVTAGIQTASAGYPCFYITWLDMCMCEWYGYYCPMTSCDLNLRCPWPE